MAKGTTEAVVGLVAAAGAAVGAWFYFKPRGIRGGEGFSSLESYPLPDEAWEPGHVTVFRVDWSEERGQILTRAFGFEATAYFRNYPEWAAVVSEGEPRRVMLQAGAGVTLSSAEINGSGTVLQETPNDVLAELQNFAAVKAGDFGDVKKRTWALRVKAKGPKGFHDVRIFLLEAK